MGHANGIENALDGYFEFRSKITANTSEGMVPRDTESSSLVLPEMLLGRHVLLHTRRRLVGLLLHRSRSTREQ